MIAPIGRDDLQPERQAALAEPNRKRHGGYAKQGPRRTIFGIAGVVQAERRLAERRQCQDRIVAGYFRIERTAPFLL